jgi:trans-aconitate methyltransferase
VRDVKETSRTTFDGDAANYDRSSKYALLRSRCGIVVTEVLECQFQALPDVGCGTGALLCLLGQQAISAKLFGIDLSGEMIKAAKAKLGQKADLRVS